MAKGDECNNEQTFSKRGREMSKRKQVKEPCPFCNGTMTPIYNGNTERLVIHSWECSRASCQFNSEYFGSNALEHRNYKKIKDMQARISQLEYLLKAQEEE